MSKERVTVSVDPEVASYLRQDAVNASGLVNNLVQKQMGGESSEAAMVKLRLEQVNSEINQTKTTLESREVERKRLQNRLSEIQEANETELDEARDTLEEVPNDPENPAVQNWADKLEMTPEELLEEL